MRIAVPSCKLLISINFLFAAVGLSKGIEEIKQIAQRGPAREVKPFLISVSDTSDYTEIVRILLKRVQQLPDNDAKPFVDVVVSVVGENKIADNNRSLLVFLRVNGAEKLPTFFIGSYSDEIKMWAMVNYFLANEKVALDTNKAETIVDRLLLGASAENSTKVQEKSLSVITWFVGANTEFHRHGTWIESPHWAFKRLVDVVPASDASRFYVYFYALKLWVPEYWAKMAGESNTEKFKKRAEETESQIIKLLGHSDKWKGVSIKVLRDLAFQDGGLEKETLEFLANSRGTPGAIKLLGEMAPDYYRDFSKLKRADAALLGEFLEGVCERPVPGTAAAEKPYLNALRWKKGNIGGNLLNKVQFRLANGILTDEAIVELSKIGEKSDRTPLLKVPVARLVKELARDTLIVEAKQLGYALGYNGNIRNFWLIVEKKQPTLLEGAYNGMSDGVLHWSTPDLVQLLQSTKIEIPRAFRMQVLKTMGSRGVVEFSMALELAQSEEARLQAVEGFGEGQENSGAKKIETAQVKYGALRLGLEDKNEEIARAAFEAAKRVPENAAFSKQLFASWKEGRLSSSLSNGVARWLLSFESVSIELSFELGKRSIGSFIFVLHNTRNQDCLLRAGQGLAIYLRGDAKPLEVLERSEIDSLNRAGEHSKSEIADPARAALNFLADGISSTNEALAETAVLSIETGKMGETTVRKVFNAWKRSNVLGVYSVRIGIWLLGTSSREETAFEMGKRGPVEFADVLLHSGEQACRSRAAAGLAEYFGAHRESQGIEFSESQIERLVEVARRSQGGEIAVAAFRALKCSHTLDAGAISSLSAALVRGSLSGEVASEVGAWLSEIPDEQLEAIRSSQIETRHVFACRTLLQKAGTSEGLNVLTQLRFGLH